MKSNTFVAALALSASVTSAAPVHFGHTSQLTARQEFPDISGYSIDRRDADPEALLPALAVGAWKVGKLGWKGFKLAKKIKKAGGLSSLFDKRDAEPEAIAQPEAIAEAEAMPIAEAVPVAEALPLADPEAFSIGKFIKGAKVGIKIFKGIKDFFDDDDKKKRDAAPEPVQEMSKRDAEAEALNLGAVFKGAKLGVKIFDGFKDAKDFFSGDKKKRDAEPELLQGMSKRSPWQGVGGGHLNKPDKEDLDDAHDKCSGVKDFFGICD